MGTEGGFPIVCRHPHIEGLPAFPMGTSAIEDYKDALGDHLTGKGTISFRYGERLPVTLVKKIVR